jgi:hypothetical protein
MRVVLALVVGLAVGFGAGFLVFDWPFGGGTQDRSAEVSDQLVRRLRADGQSIQFANCSPRQATSSQYNCEAVADDAAFTVRYVVTMRADGSIAYRNVGIG